MGILEAICVLIAVLGVLLIVLSLVPATTGYIPHGIGVGITLVVVGIFLYIVLVLLLHVGTYGP